MVVPIAADVADAAAAAVVVNVDHSDGGVVAVAVDDDDDYYYYGSCRPRLVSMSTVTTTCLYVAANCQ
jgi:hypothetical protein